VLALSEGSIQLLLFSERLPATRSHPAEEACRHRTGTDSRTVSNLGMSRATSCTAPLETTEGPSPTECLTRRTRLRVLVRSNANRRSAGGVRTHHGGG
jgi:hypothetical protein